MLGVVLLYVGIVLINNGIARIANIAIQQLQGYYLDLHIYL